jgi:parallel beta-helix repeat protein
MENRKTKIIIKLWVIFLVIALALIIPKNIEAATITVPDDYPTIQLAVNAAISGDIVYIQAGTYYEHVTINKSLTLQGEDRETTLIDGNSTGKVVYVTSSNVTITGITIKKGGNSTSNPQDAGITLNSASNVLISNCIITDCRLNGIFAQYSSYCTIQDCDICYNEPSSVNDGGYRGAIHFRNSHHMTINGNNVYENDGWGMAVRTNCNYAVITNNQVYLNPGNGIHLGWSSSCQVSNNISHDNATGIDFDACSNCTANDNVAFSNVNGVFAGYYSISNVIRNNVLRNNVNGVYIYQSNVTNNRIYHNDFIDNTVQATDSYGTNIWDNGYPSGGNYWKDYTGEDLNNDGIGDTPYSFANKQDNYPLMNSLFNTPPVITSVSAPVDPVQIDSEITLEINYTDGENNETSVTIDWGDENPPVTFTENLSSPLLKNHTYLTPGVYSVEVNIMDDYGESDNETYQYIVIYDPTAGFVTGGGWIMSPEGAYIPVPELSGKASFGFVSKYKKGQTTPDGNTEFQFKAGNLNFKSVEYDWLVIAGAKAQFKGVGTINNLGNYGFLLSAVDAELTPSTLVDKFRIKIWDKDDGDVVVYDNNIYAEDTADPVTEIGGGSIVIHSVKNKSAQIKFELHEVENHKLMVYPNPFNDIVTFEFVSQEATNARIDIYDVTGRLVTTVFNNQVKEGVLYNTEFNPVNINSGNLFYRMTLGEKIINGKLVYKK